MQKCPEDLPPLPERDLPRREIKRLWGNDIVSYRVCAGRNNRLVDAVQDRDARLTSPK